MIEWFVRNPVAANLLMLAIIITGWLSLNRSVSVEVFPSFEIESVTVATVFRGATPKTVEDSVTKRIEDAIYNLEGVKEIASRSVENQSVVIAEVAEGYDKRKILNDVKLRVDALNSLPRDADKPIITLSSFNESVITVAVAGDVDEKTLRIMADKVQSDLLNQPNITLVDLIGAKNYEISVEIEPATLQKLNLTLAQVADTISKGSVDISAGNVKTVDGDILIRTDGQAYTGQDFSHIAVINQLGSDPILLGDIARVTDGFEQQPILALFDNKPAIMMQVRRTGKQSSIQIAKTVRDYIEQTNPSLNNGVQLSFWQDRSRILRARLATLISSGIQGGILVLLLLSLFLRPAIAFWVFLGVPVSFMGAFIFMPSLGGTINVVSLFAFITVLGIVVDDAIVTGENIYRKMRQGVDSTTAAITGTKQIALPVTFGILTTIVAFLPMANLGANRMGYFAIQIPIVVIPVLLFSLIESKFVLPSHLSHVKPRDERASKTWLSRLQMKISRGLENAVIQHYQPFLKRCLHNKALTLVVLFAISAVLLTWTATGHLRFIFFPDVEAEEIQMSLKMPDTTGFDTTQRHIDFISRQVDSLQKKYTDPDSGKSIIQHTYTSIGSDQRSISPSVGVVRAELQGPEDRYIEINASELARELRNNIGEIPGAEKFSVNASLGRSGEPVNIELSGLGVSQMSLVGNQLRQQLKQYPGVFDIQDNYSGGKEQLELALNPKAHALGLSLGDIAQQTRGSIFGFEAQKFQRGRNEVRVMVRLPEAYRSSVEDLARLPIYINSQATPIPLSDLANITPTKSPTVLYRLNRNAIINITADVDKKNTNIPAIISELRETLKQQQEHHPSLRFAFKGEAEEQSENTAGMKVGAVLVLLAIYALLAIPFKSYTQPLIIMSIIPFSFIGSIIGHVLMGYQISFLSLVGIMALLGVVINDSLVLVDYTNKLRQAGNSAYDAVVTAGVTRFRPVLLTSLTTFAGLTPLLLGNDTQSQFLIPMAISLSFGILFATAITLIIVPVNYLLAHQAKQESKRWLNNLWHGLSSSEAVK